MNTITTDIATLSDSYVANNCGELLYPNGSISRAPVGWAVNPEEERDGRLGREFYHYSGARVFVPMLPAEPDQDWENETTTWTLEDGTRVQACGAQVRVLPAVGE